jgi:hypothetical protein
VFVPFILLYKRQRVSAPFTLGILGTSNFRHLPLLASPLFIFTQINLLSSIQPYSSAVTGQPAIHVGAFFTVTVDTLFHAPVLGRQAVLVLHFPMTLLTLNVGADMSLVVEENMLCNTIDLYPGRWCPGVVIAMLDLNPGMICNNMVVTVQAFFYRWQTRMIGVINVRMAEAALNVFDTGMDGVAERNRLLRTDPSRRRKPEIINKQAGE